jgi:hypothetical protein
MVTRRSSFIVRLQPRVLSSGALQNRDISVSILPQGQERLICSPGPGPLSRQNEHPTELQVSQRTDGIEADDAGTPGLEQMVSADTAGRSLAEGPFGPVRAEFISPCTLAWALPMDSDGSRRLLALMCVTSQLATECHTSGKSTDRQYRSPARASALGGSLGVDRGRIEHPASCCS